MKKYLKDLEAELKKLKISDAEVQEILADHREMIEAAQADGISDEELVEKFGEPKAVAQELKSDVLEAKSQKSEPVVGEGELEGYELFKTFPVIDEVKEVQIKLVSEDLVYFPYDGTSIQVYAKKLKKPDNYKVTFEEGVFVLKRLSSKSFGLFGGNSSPDFGVMVPFELYYDNFDVASVSGDYKLDSINTKSFSANSTSGDYELSNLKVTEAKFRTVSGDIEVSGLNGEEVQVSLVSGDLELENARVEKELNVNTVSGDVDVDNFFGEHIAFKSVSGDLSGKEAYPNSVDLKSVSGDIKISNSNKSHKIDVKYKKSISGDIRIN